MASVEFYGVRWLGLALTKCPVEDQKHRTPQEATTQIANARWQTNWQLYIYIYNRIASDSTSSGRVTAVSVILAEAVLDRLACGAGL